MPREVSIKVFKYEELSDRAKGIALSNHQSNGDYPWNEENKCSLEKFADIFPVKVRNWEYGGNYNHVDWTFTEEDEIAELKGIRLMTYLYNNYFRNIFKGKYYSTKGYYDENAKYHYKKRYSKVQFENSCVLTGYWTDDAILDPIYKFLKAPNDMSFKDLLDDCFQEWVIACNKDYEYYYSEESFKETCEANEWEFTENGEMH